MFTNVNIIGFFIYLTANWKFFNIDAQTWINLMVEPTFHKEKVKLELDLDKVITNKGIKIWVTQFKK